MSTYHNTYIPPSPPTLPPTPHLTTPLASYDLNFCFSPIKSLDGHGTSVRLEPFIPSLHAQQLFDAMSPSPELFRLMPVNIGSDLKGLLQWAEKMHRTVPANLLYIIYDLKRTPGTPQVAGMIAYINSSRPDLVTELGWVTVLPSYQRTHVLTHSAFLLLKNAFDLPSEGGWGLRRVQWQANELNTPSINSALRLGFLDEGRIRNQRMLLPGLEGSYPGRPGDPGWVDDDEAGRTNGKGSWSRTTAMLGMCAGDWEGKDGEEGKGERLRGMLERK